MFERNPNALFYLALVGVSMLFSAAMVFINTPHARARGFSKWKNHLAPEILVLAANIALVWYTFSAIPAAFAKVLGETVNQTFFLLCLVHAFWFIASKGMLFMREAIAAGQPQSFIAHLFSRSDRSSRENIRANEYAVMGTLGSAIGVPYIATAEPSSQSKIMMFIVICGLFSWLVLWLTRRIFGAHEL
jgi:hypothetical protein